MNLYKPNLTNTYKKKCKGSDYPFPSYMYVYALITWLSSTHCLDDGFKTTSPCFMFPFSKRSINTRNSRVIQICQDLHLFLQHREDPVVNKQ